MHSQTSTQKLNTTSRDLLPFIESLPDAVIIVDPEHKIVLINTHASDMFGYPTDSLEGLDLQAIIPATHRHVHKKRVDQYFRSPNTKAMSVQKRFSGLRADGTEIPVEIMLNTIVLDGATAAMAVVRDVSYQRELEDRLIQESLTDEMTGLYNRKHFKAQLEAQHSGFIRSALPSSLILFDFDHFKNINDEYGHAAGDTVLIKAAKVVQGELRPLDIGCRIGGEEFAIILPNTQLRDAVTLAERIRDRIEKTEFRLDDSTCRITVTMGVASFTPSDQSYDSLMKRADKLLYAGKAAGRNCIISQECPTATKILPQ